MKIDLMQTLPEYFREILEFKELMKTDQAVLAEPRNCSRFLLLGR